jgi:hypothetical protein
MVTNIKFLSESFEYLKKQAPVLFFILSENGIIIESGGYAIYRAGHKLIGTNFRDIVVDFKENFDLKALINNPCQEILLSIYIDSGLPQSYYFTFKQIDNHVMAFGRLDAEDLDKMSKEMFLLNQELSNLTRKLNKKNAKLQEALNHVKSLQGIIPICMHCHNIRNDKKVWDRIEAYFSEHTEATFSHSICPECAKKYYPDMDIYDD